MCEMSPMMEPALNGGSPSANCTTQSLCFCLYNFMVN